MFGRIVGCVDKLPAPKSFTRCEDCFAAKRVKIVASSHFHSYTPLPQGSSTLVFRACAPIYVRVPWMQQKHQKLWRLICAITLPLRSGRRLVQGVQRSVSGRTAQVLLIWQHLVVLLPETPESTWSSRYIHAYSNLLSVDAIMLDVQCIPEHSTMHVSAFACMRMYIDKGTYCIIYIYIYIYINANASTSQQVNLCVCCALCII